MIHLGYIAAIVVLCLIIRRAMIERKRLTLAADSYHRMASDFAHKLAWYEKDEERIQATKLAIAETVHEFRTKDLPRLKPHIVITPREYFDAAEELHEAERQKAEQK